MIFFLCLVFLEQELKLNYVESKPGERNILHCMNKYKRPFNFLIVSFLFHGMDSRQLRSQCI